MLPGRTRSWLASPALGLMMETVGMLSACVSFFSAAVASRRGRIPQTRAAANTATMTPIAIQRCRTRRVPTPDGGYEFMCSSLNGGFLFLSGDRRERTAACAPPVYDRKDHGHEKQRGDGREQQPADHRAAERCILLP